MEKKKEPTQSTHWVSKVISTVSNMGTGGASIAKKTIQSRAEQIKKAEEASMGK